MQELIKKAFVPAIAILALILAFGLGRLSKLTNQAPDLIVDKTSESLPNVLGSSTANAVVGENGSRQLVGSKNGTKYHYVWCSGAKRITEANKVWFATREEAGKAGYTPAANCPGL